MKKSALIWTLAMYILHIFVFITTLIAGFFIYGFDTTLAGQLALYVTTFSLIATGPAYFYEYSDPTRTSEFVGNYLYLIFVLGAMILVAFTIGVVGLRILEALNSWEKMEIFAPLPIALRLALYLVPFSLVASFVVEYRRKKNAKKMVFYPVE